MALLRILWSHRRVVLLSALLAVIVAVPFGLLRPPSYQSTTQLVLPPRDPVARTADKGDTSVVLARLQYYIDNDLESAVGKRLGKQAGTLDSVSASKGATSPFFTVTAQASKGRTAQAGVDAASTLLIEKYSGYAKDQVDLLNKQANDQLAPLNSQEPPLQADQAAKQNDVDSLHRQAQQLQASVANARDAVSRAQITGKFASVPAAQQVASSLQSQLDALNSAIAPKEAELERVKAQVSIIEGKRKSVSDLLQQADQAYIASLVRASTTEPASVPQTSTVLRLAEAAALGILVGLLASSLTIAWLERARVSAIVRSAVGRATGASVTELQPVEETPKEDTPRTGPIGVASPMQPPVRPAEPSRRAEPQGPLAQPGPAPSSSSDAATPSWAIRPSPERPTYSRQSGAFPPRPQ